MFLLLLVYHTWISEANGSLQIKSSLIKKVGNSTTMFKSSDIYLVILIFLKVIYFWKTERQSMSRGESEREGDTESEAGSRLRVVELSAQGLMRIMTWA